MPDRLPQRRPHRDECARRVASAFARVTEHLGYPTQALHFQEAYVFGLDDEGRVNRIEIFWQTPQYDPTGLDSGLRR